MKRLVRDSGLGAKIYVDKLPFAGKTFDIIGHLAKPEVGACIVTPDGVELPIKAQGRKNE